MKKGKLRKLFTPIQTKYIKKDDPLITRKSNIDALRVLLSKRATRHDIQQFTGHINAPEYVGRTDEKIDFNDLHQREGLQAVKRLINVSSELKSLIYKGLSVLK